MTGMHRYSSVEREVTPLGDVVEWEEDHSSTWTCVMEGSSVVSFSFDGRQESETPLPSDPQPTPVWLAEPKPEPEPAQEREPEACLIKGNVSYDTGERIYHVPGQEYYDETAVNENYGERWFCTEDEAIVAGWRKSWT